jgi:hypothetical protein
MNKKIATLTLLTLTGFAAVISGLLMTAQATETNAATTNTTASTNDQSNSSTAFSLWGNGNMGAMMATGGFEGGPRGHGDHGFGGMGSIEVSSEYNATVTAILDNDTDVQNLISEGYNVTSINPIVKSVVTADGTVTTKATTATVFLQNGTSGYTTVSVDVTNAKVTEIVIITRTVIDKTSG